MPRKTANVTKRRDVRTHANLWHTSKCLLERGQEQEKASFHQYMASLVFTAFAFETYLNWIGQKKVANWKYLERLNPKEKLEVVAAQVHVEVKPGQRPWNIVTELFGFRNDIAHAKPQQLTSDTTEPVDEYLDGKLGNLIRTDWERFCTPKNAMRAREDVLSIAQAIHEAAALDGEPEPFFSGFQVHGATLNP
jgi:hypothetical protein